MKTQSDNLEQDKDLLEFRRLLSNGRCKVVDEVEPSPDFTSRVLLAIDESVEKNQRAEWASLASARNLDLSDIVEPKNDFSVNVLKKVKQTKRLSQIKLIWRYAAAAAAVLAIALLVIPEKHGARPIAMRTGPYSDRNLDEAKAFTQVDSAIDWLASHQEPDGSWAPKVVGGKEAFRPALTALGMMAIGRHAQERRSDAIKNAVNALRSMQQSDGSFNSDKQTQLYNHAFATYALIEHAKNNGAGLDEIIAEAIAFSVANQNPYGAWDYQKDGFGNAALTLWQVSLLIEANKLGWRDNDGALRRAVAWLKRESAKGVFDYRQTLDRQHASASGGIILTQLATEALVQFCNEKPSLNALAANAKTSFDTAYGRYTVRQLGKESALDSVLCKTFRGGEDFYPTLIALLSSRRY